MSQKDKSDLLQSGYREQEVVEAIPRVSVIAGCSQKPCHQQLAMRYEPGDCQSASHGHPNDHHTYRRVRYVKPLKAVAGTEAI